VFRSFGCAGSDGSRFVADCAMKPVVLRDFIAISDRVRGRRVVHSVVVEDGPCEV